MTCILIEVEQFETNIQQILYNGQVTGTDLIRLLSIHAPPTIGKRIGQDTYIHSSILDRNAINQIGNIFNCEFDVKTEDIIVKYRNGSTMKITFLHYPKFMEIAHPKLCCALSFTSDSNPRRRVWRGENRPILHRKELFLPLEHPRREMFRRLTEREVELGLLENPSKIGRSKNWNARLVNAGITICGHEIKLVGNDD